MDLLEKQGNAAVNHAEAIKSRQTKLFDHNNKADATMRYRLRLLKERKEDLSKELAVKQAQASSRREANMKSR
jgi:hypothetical protein